MKTFRDKLNNPWDIDVNGETVARVKSLTGFLLTELVTPKGSAELGEDPVRFMQVLFACCKPQADERKTDEPTFLRNLNGDAVDAAVTAMTDEVIDFFQSSRRQAVRLMVDKTKALTDEATRRVILELEKMDPAAVLEKVLGRNSGASPESSVLTPPASPSAASA